MTEKNGVGSGEASKKPTQDIDLKAKKAQYLAKLRAGETTAKEAEAKKKVILQKVKEADWPVEGKLIPDLNHTYRLKRMKRVFGDQQIADLEASCSNRDDFKMALFKAEQASSLPVLKKDKPYAPIPNSGGASPKTIVWKDKTWEVDEQSDFKVEYCDKLIAFMQPGRSLKSFSGHIEESYTTVLGWMKRYKIFQFAYEIAEAKSLQLIEDILFSLGAGRDVNKMAESFGVIKPNAQVMMFIAKSRFRKDFFEIIKVEDGNTKDLASLTGDELAKAVARIKLRHERVNSPSPFAQMNLYTGEG